MSQHGPYPSSLYSGRTDRSWHFSATVAQGPSELQQHPPRKQLPRPPTRRPFHSHPERLRHRQPKPLPNPKQAPGGDGDGRQQHHATAFTSQSTSSAKAETPRPVPKKVDANPEFT